MTLNGSPKNWEVKKLGEVCKLKNGFAFKSTEYKDDGIPVIRISDIKDGIVSSGKAVRITQSDEFDNYLIENNDILVAMSGATTGKFGIFRSKEKAYRQAVLKWAFEGKLTNEDLSDGELPNGWRWMTLGDVTKNVEYGSAAKSKPEGRVPVLRMGNIQNGKFDWTDLVYTDDEAEIE